MTNSLHNQKTDRDRMVHGATNFVDILLRSVDAFCDEYERTGKIRPGSNGPHGHKETPVRNASHWLISLSRAHTMASKPRYKDAAASLARYLTSDEARPYGFSFHHRSEPNVDRCNGLIGQAWTFEALAEATHFLSDDNFGKLGEEVFFQHRFDRSFSLWHSLDIDGTVLNLDNVFNHQLWFAACASLLPGPRREQVLTRIQAFMDALPENLTLSEDGQVQHNVYRVLRSPRHRLYGVLKHIRQGTLLHRVLHKPVRAAKDTRFSAAARNIGYHAFNTYAFGLLFEALPSHPFWSSARFRKCATYLLREDYRLGLENSGYGYEYNPPGFEVTFSVSKLISNEEVDHIGTANYWLNQQFTRSYDPQTRMFSANCPDPETQSARLYEAMRIPLDILSSVEVRP